MASDLPTIEYVGADGVRREQHLTNIMGSEAHHPPSEVAGSDVHAAQVKLGEGDE